MGKIRFVVVSDMHAGAELSLATAVDETGARTDPTIPSITAAAFGRAVQSVLMQQNTALAAMDDPATIILLGDIMDLAFSDRNAAAQSYVGWLKGLVGAQAGLFAPDMIFLPGNHDHSLWTSARMAAETASVAAGGAPQMALYTRSETGNALPSGFVTALNQRAGIYGDVRIHYPNFALHDPTLGRCVAFHHGHFLDSAYRMMSAAHDMLTGVPRLHVTVAELADENANWIDFGWSSFGQSSTLSRDVATLYTGLSVASEAHHLRQRIARAISAELGPKLPMGGQEGVKAALRYTVLAALDASFGAYTDTARASISDALSDSGVDGVQAYIDGPLAGQLRDELGHIPPQLSFVFGHTHKPFIDTLVPAKGPVVQLCNTGGWYLDSPRLNGREGVALVLVDDMLNVVSVRCFATPQNGAVAPTEVRLASHPTPDGEAFAAEVAGYVAAAGPVWAHLAQVAATEYALRQEMLLARLNRSDHEAIIAGGMPMTRIQLSKPLSDAKARYEVVVIGSGYGASIAASRLARAGREVAVLERGREMRPGDFPRSMTEIAGDAQVQVAETGKRLGRADGLLDFHLNDDLSVLIGCGLGGTSLINANVALESDPRLIDHFNWPAVYRDNPGLLAPYYERARKALGSRPYPETAPALPKLAALQQSATEMGKPFYRPPINVTFEDGPNAFGFAQNACNLCGDCCTGCNYGAKNTTLMNYLPDARAHGAQIFTGAEVRHLEKTATGWDVHIRPIEGGAVRVISADLVVMGAGTLGSTEILLRSKTKGLALSKQLGQRFSGNGDVLAFGYNANLDGDMDGETPRPMLRGIGAGSNAPDLPEYQPGPCIAGIIDCRDPAAPVTDGMVIEEGVMPGGLAMGFSAIFFLNQAITGDPFKFGDTSLRLQDAADVGNAINTDPASLSRFAYDGPVGRTQTYLVMSHDASDGEVTLTNDQAVVRWQGAGSEPSILRNNKILAQASDAIWAEFQPNPMWQTEMGRKLVTVHPIGGCVMADSADTGVVNGDCQVFDGAGGVHAGLYVCDGAVIPGALGVNPLLTISAVAEYAVEQMATSRGWTIEYTGTRPLPAECHVPDPIKPPPPPDIAAQLQSIIDAMKASKTLIDNGDYAAARAIFEAAYKAVTEGVDSPLAPSWAVLRLMLTDTLMRAIAEVFAEFLPILEAVDAKIDSGDFLGALTVIEDAAGDFTPGLRFDEKMEGVIAPADRQMDRPISDAYRVAQRRGEMTGPEAAIVGHFTISTESIERLLTDPDHRATLTGTIDCPALGGRLILDEGAVFDLLRANDGEIECWNMIYSGKMQDSDDETPFYFKGVKTLKRRAGSSWWTDLTTLNVDIWDGTAPHGLPRFQGIMTLGLEDLAQQLSTVQTPMAQNIWTSGFDILATLVAAQWQGNLAQRLQDQDLRAEIIRQGLMIAARMGHPGLLEIVQQNEVMRFGSVFAKLVFRCYGGVTAYLNNFPALDDAQAPHRPMRLPAPEVHVPMVGDKALGLTRYKGGTLGPVILAPGFGVTAASYAMDTTDENLAEFLVARGYDVWLFDYRGSPALDASRQPFTIDDIAREDWPAAIEMVRDNTGAADVQIIAHCFASTSVLMGLLAGMKGVRSVVSSQTSLHPISGWFNYAKADSHLANLLVQGVPKAMRGLVDGIGLPPALGDIVKYGMKTVDMVSIVDPSAEGYMAAKTLDALLWPVPFPGEIPCYNPVCHRVFGVFGPSFAHDQLNEATHNALGRVFGKISTEPFLQLAEILRWGKAVDAGGADTYMNTPENIDIPIDFVAGGKNRIFLPETTLRTLHWLRATHKDAPKNMFTRVVFEEYAHMDIFIGKNAHHEVFPYLLDRLRARDGGVQA